MAAEWSPSSWWSKSIAQDVTYPNPEKLPAPFMPAEIERLLYQLSLVQWNKAFLLHAGDCAESFDACTQQNISAKIGLILSFSSILIWGAHLPVVRIGRTAGQYTKTRSSPTETIEGKVVTSVRGDNVNGLDPNNHTPNPQRLLSAYSHSTATLNHVQGLLTSGFPSLHHPRDRSFNHVRSSNSEFEFIVGGLSDALDFGRAISGERSPPFEHGGGRGTVGEVDFYTSHEGLMLDYEKALTRPAPPGSGHYNTSVHFLWIGDRTRQLDGAHPEHLCGIRNPIGIYVGSSMAGDELAKLLDVVNPSKEPGRITLISRYDAEKIDAHLPGHIETVKRSGHPVVWICDPMHGKVVRKRLAVGLASCQKEP
ncbi:DAHP synthetase [Armillaria mellea]|nr:DAHP synthetase [Armillaria mellea]